MQRNFKILLSAYACEPGKGSEPGVGWNWAREIANRGYEVFVLTRENNKKKIQYLFHGDDYQILFTAPKENRLLIKSIGKKMNQKITIIGKINNGYKKNLIKLDNKPQNLTNFKGYSHKF